MMLKKVVESMAVSLLPSGRRNAPAWFAHQDLCLSSILSVLLSLFALTGTAAADSAAPAELLKGIDLHGRLHRLCEGKDLRAVVLLFLSTECPISNSYIPELNRLHDEYAARGVSCYGVISLPHVTRTEALKHRGTYRIGFPVLFDASGELRQRFTPTHTPQALVLDPAGNVRYSGRIDDRFAALGRKRPETNQTDLVNALDAVLDDREVSVAFTEPIGCLLEDVPQDRQSGPVTFNRDIAPILFTHCASCHRPGESAPFSLLTYEDASRHALQIRDVVRSRYMPPWHAVPGFGEFREERRLTEIEIELLSTWADSGKPEGNPDDLPPRPVFTRGWSLGKPDLILKMPQAFTLPAEGPDVHQHFVLPTALRENRLVKAVEFRPGNPRIVHHAAFYIDTTGAARKLDAADPDFGYGSFGGPGFRNIGSLRSWLPGSTPQDLPEGMGRLLPKRSDLILEIHYQCTGKPEQDQSTVGIYFAPRKARQLVCELQVLNLDLTIPAGAARHPHRASYTLPAEALLIDAAPHMHLLGREMKAVATLPDGRVEPLIWIRNWDFNWQGQYIYEEPIRLPAGTRIDVDAWYDNSAGNPLNPHSPPVDVRWGEQTIDEMGICHFRYTCDTMRELTTIVRHHDKFLRDQAAQHFPRR